MPSILYKDRSLISIKRGGIMIKLAGIKFKLNLLFLFVLIMFALSGLFIKASLTFLIVFIHELAHTITAKRLEVNVNEIELLPFGGVAKFKDLIQLEPRKEIKVALAGPILNFTLVLIALLLLRYNIITTRYGIFFIRLNLTIGLFNLLPIFPLDGGRVLRAKFTIKYGFKEATYKVLKYSKIVAIIMAFIAIIGIYFGCVNILLLIIAFFVYFTILKEGRYTAYVLMQYIAKKKGNILKERVVDIQPLIAIKDTPLKEIIDRLVPNKFHTILVVDDGFEILGLVTEDKLINYLVNEGIEVPVEEIIN